MLLNTYVWVWNVDDWRGRERTGLVDFKMSSYRLLKIKWADRFANEEVLDWIREKENGERMWGREQPKDKNF